MPRLDAPPAPPLGSRPRWIASELEPVAIELVLGEGVVGC